MVTLVSTNISPLDLKSPFSPNPLPAILILSQICVPLGIFTLIFSSG
ncbi:MAG: hypothetical protein LBH96_03805 [Candidatus Peribacteria bacterium]|nr:hypothetical protein [Candidatus Peribacteria bacterium]